MTKSRKGTPPASPAPNLHKPGHDDLTPLNFKVPAEFARDFKVYAAMHNMKLVELLKASFEAFKN
jgi:hypothetical protein